MRWILCVLLGAACLVGCGKSTSSPEEARLDPPVVNWSPDAPSAPSDATGAEQVATDSAPPTPVQTAQIPPPSAKPESVVATFLEATRGGDQHVAAALLTSKAIEETRKRGLTVQPPGSPTMKYEIGRAEMSEDNEGVWVTSVWRETLEDGTVESYEIVWVLRKEQPGWRIAGMAAQLSPDESPMLINFEQPDELERRVTGTGNADSGAAAQQAQTPPAGAQR